MILGGLREERGGESRETEKERERASERERKRERGGGGGRWRERERESVRVSESIRESCNRHCVSVVRVCE